MKKYQQNLKEEKHYLCKTLEFIKSELDKKTQTLADRKKELVEVRKEMWENAAHHSHDFDKLTEMNQYLSVHTSRLSDYETPYKQIEKYKRMLPAPYFGRFDFIEDGTNEKERIYVGLHNVIDSETYDIYVYDWRAPISGIFYQYELGEACYRAPQGTISGDVLLKRQYKIHDGELEYFFDCSLKIDDEMLQQVLCRNTSPRMKNIVETIQKEQNNIIRDVENELLIVQGVAGSGKTSIALHRIAFLLYHGMNSNLDVNNVLIISPNEIFSKYISGVLPELGEENVRQITFDDLGGKLLGDRFNIEKRMEQLEWIIGCENSEEQVSRKSSIEFKGSSTFVQILKRLVRYYAHNRIGFEDIYYDNRIIETKHLLKNQFLNDKIGRPMAKRLKRIEKIIFEKIHPLRKERLEKIERLVQKMGGHEFEIKSFSRLLSMKESNTLLKRIRSFTEIDFFEVYRSLFTEKGLLYKLAGGLELPEHMEQIIENTRKNLQHYNVQFEDCGPLLLLRLMIEGSDIFSEIKHAVVDEAQDYSPVQYEVFNLLFKNARFTVLGDVHQAIEKTGSLNLYNRIDEILGKRKSTRLFLNKSYRSSYEISNFSKKLLDFQQECVSFERHESEPLIISKDSTVGMEAETVGIINGFIEEGHRTVAVICKTVKDTIKIHNKLKDKLNMKLISSMNDVIETGVIIIPAYMAKGLEFDAVIVYNTSNEHYRNDLDRRLLYIACTRALHRLVLIYAGNKSDFIPAEELAKSYH